VPTTAQPLDNVRDQASRAGPADGDNRRPVHLSD
jgi:hypothetical protein